MIEFIALGLVAVAIVVFGLALAYLIAGSRDL